MEAKIIHDIEVIDQEWIIVQSKTGIYWTTQVGGNCCRHPIVEGYILPFDSIEKSNFADDCYCLHDLAWHRCEKTEEKRLYIEKTFKSFKARGNEYLSSSISNFVKDISLDEDRKHELMEGWWPIKGLLILVNEKYDSSNLEFKGYLVRENCD